MGKIIDENGPILAANVYYKSNPALGTTSDIEGFFKLIITNRKDTLVVSYIGHEKLNIPFMELKRNEINIFKLKVKSDVLNEIVIKGRDPISQQFSVVKLNKMDIYLNPVAQGDPLKAITILPASTIIDETANPSLRGSDPDRTRVVLNGVPIYNPVRASQINNQGFFSLFNPELIDKQYVYASNPPLTFGNSSAGLVEIQTTKNLENNQLKLSSTLVSTGFLVSKKIKNQNSFLQVYGNYQFSDAFIGIQEQNLPDLSNFNTLDFGVNLAFELDKKWILNSYTYFIDEAFMGFNERFTYRGPFNSSKTRVFSVNSVDYANRNTYLSMNTGINFENQNFEFGNTLSDQEAKQLYLSLNYKVNLEKIDIQSVVSMDQQFNSFDDTFAEFFYALSPESPSLSSLNSLDNNALEGAIYASWKPDSKITLSSGVRVNLPTKSQSSFLSWQFGTKYKMNNHHSLLLSGGKYHNYTTPSIFRPRYDLLNSDQIALDYTYEETNTTMTSALYYKTEGGNQFILGGIPIDNIQTLGFEIFFKQRFNSNLSWSASYSYIDQNLRIGDSKFAGFRDADYFIKSTLEFNHPKWFTVSLNWIGRTGSRYTGIVSGETDPNSDFFRPLFSNELFGDQFNDYNRLDVNINKYISWNNKELVLFASVNNLLNTQNQRRDQYNEDYTARRFDLFQKRLLFFGLVWTLN
ncbi:MAG: carboxypeptidase-like regulatory domain-containing protein [Bacteroidota bacterium]